MKSSATIQHPQLVSLSLSLPRRHQAVDEDVVKERGSLARFHDRLFTASNIHPVSA